jgi:hypothetical protein
MTFGHCGWHKSNLSLKTTSNNYELLIMEYNIAASERMGSAFGRTQNLLYVPAVLALGLKKTDSVNRGKYALNNTFDRIQVTKPQVYEFPLDPLVEVSWGFRNVITEVTKGYPVLEQVGKELMAVRIKGIIWDGSETYPESEVKDFVALFKQQTILEVNSRIFNIYGIKNIFISGVQMPALDGFEDTQPYEIQAYSYNEVELEVIEL